MRFQNFVQRYVLAVADGDAMRIQNFATYINGGWEVWMQVEIYWNLYNALGGPVADFEREPYYNPPGGQRADFKFTPGNADLVTTWVELKTQRRGRVRQAATEFARDVEKVRLDAPADAQNTSGAVVLIPIGNAKTILEEVRGAITESTQVDPHNVNYEFLYNGQSYSGRLDAIGDYRNVDNAILVCYYSKL